MSKVGYFECKVSRMDIYGWCNNNNQKMSGLTSLTTTILKVNFDFTPPQKSIDIILSYQ